MIIPKHKTLRDRKVIQIRDACLFSRSAREVNYSRRRRYFMFGTNTFERCKYNRLFSHLDLVSAFLYSPDHATYSLAASLNAQDVIIAQAMTLADYWNQKFRESGIAYLYGLALLWALIYDTMLIKLGWNDARDRLEGKLIHPYSFGVYDESEPDFDSQEAFVHVYRLHWDEAAARLARAGQLDRMKDLGLKQGTPIDDMPPALKNLILTSLGSTNLNANIMGQAPLDVQPEVRYEPQTDIPTAEFHELWVWDTILEDYVQFIIADPDIILSDSRETVDRMIADGKDARIKHDGEYTTKCNLFLPGTSPFVPVTPYMLTNYFWGEAHIERLIPLQDWSNERLGQIAEIMEMQADPAKIFSGFSGLSDEKMGVFGGPGSWVTDMLPGADVKSFKPDQPEDIFAEYDKIGQYLLEASGLTATVTGQGESGVRGKGHAKQLAVTGSARIRKTAIGQEPPLVAIGEIALRLIQENDDTALISEDGSEFLPAQFAEEEDHWSLRIAGHSHSPLFADESRELAQGLFKDQAIDREMLVRLMHPPERDVIISRLRKRIIEEAKARAQGAEPEGGGKGKPKPNGHAHKPEGAHAQT
jgi:hypothetical protein